MSLPLISGPTQILMVLIDALESQEQGSLEQCVITNRAQLIPHADGETPAEFGGFLTPSGYCPVSVTTLLSVDIQKKAHYHHEDKALHDLMKERKIAQLHTLLKAGLVPWSMAGDLGEAERKAACETPFVWFTLDEPSLAKWPDADSDGWDDGWGTYFGLDWFHQVQPYADCDPPRS